MKKVLIVDDSQSIRQQVAQTLARAGFTVLEAGDGVDGLLQATKNHDLALALVDVNMPRMNGLDMLDKLRAEPATATLPVLMLTTEAEPALIERAKKAGAKGWIIKPANADLLVNAVNKLSR